MQKSFKVIGLDCASCGDKIERRISKIKEVKDVSVNFMLMKMNIEFSIYDENVKSKIEKAVKKVNKKCEITEL